jgi:hypothetical protein
MPFSATVYTVMIACPGDIVCERRIAREVIADWNVANARKLTIVLLGAGWETDSIPLAGGRPQTLINRQILADSDLLVAVFWTRLGTPTGAAASGTAEEIEEHLKAGKPTLVYFSNALVNPAGMDSKQHKALEEFKGLCRKRGLVETYDDPEDFRRIFARQLAKTVNTHQHFASAQRPTREKPRKKSSNWAVQVLVSGNEQEVSAFSDALLQYRICEQVEGALEQNGIRRIGLVDLGRDKAGVELDIRAIKAKFPGVGIKGIIVK